MLRRFLRNKGAVFGLVIIAVLVLVAIFGEYILPWRYDVKDRNAYYAPPDGIHWFGTTQSGGDVLALTVRGLGKSLIIGFAAGAVQGYFGGLTDLLFQRFIELWSSVPTLYVIIILTAVWAKSFWLLVPR